MSGTLPLTPKFTSAGISSVWPGLITETDVGSTQRVNYMGHYFRAQCTYPLMKLTTAKPILAFLQKQQGGYDNFAAAIEGYINADGAVYAKHLLHSGTIGTDLTSSTNYVVGTSAITFNSNFTSTYYTSGSDGDFFKDGDMIKFSNHNKLYMVVDSTNPGTDGNGGIINIQPGLTTAITSSHTIQYHTVYGQWFLESQDINWNTGLAETVELEITLREDV